MAKQTKGQPTVLQQDILDLWVQGVSNKEIAERLNCSVESVRNVKKNDDYKQQFYERQAAQIIELIPLAVKRLRDMLKDDDVQASVQIAAIKEVFDRAHLSELTDSTDNEIKITVSYE